MADVKIKVCGLTQEREADILAECGVEFAGMVLFFPKSKRNVSLETAEKILKRIKQRGVSKAVAVTVSPDIKQVEHIMELGFDYIQVHGTLKKEVYDIVTIPIIRAVNVTEYSGQEELRTQFREVFALKKTAGILFDGSSPGAGKTFDWNILKDLKSPEKLLILAGGLNAENVKAAIRQVQPDVVDVSSGVEYDLPEGEEFAGKDEEKIKEFVMSAVPQKAAEWRKS